MAKRKRRRLAASSTGTTDTAIAGGGGGCGGGGRYNMRRRLDNTSKQSRRPDARSSSKHMSSCGLLRCAESVSHTASVVVCHVPLVDVEADLDGDGDAAKESSGAHKKKGRKKKARKRKQPKTVVVTSSNLQNVCNQSSPTASIISTAGSSSAVEESSPSSSSIPAETTAKAATAERSPKSRVSKLFVPVVHVKPLLVLDLNGVLCRRVRYDQIRGEQQEEKPIDAAVSKMCRDTAAAATTTTARINFRPSIGHVAGTPVIARTDLSDLLYFLDSNFSLAVWTSAKLKTAKGLIQMLFPRDVADRLLFVWGQNKCDAKKKKKVVTNTMRQEEEEKKEGNGIGDGRNGKGRDADSNTKHACSTPSRSNADTVFEKSLSKVWGIYPLWDATNTLLIDDSPEKAQKWTENTLHPPPILGTATRDGGACKEDGDQRQQHPDESNEEDQVAFFHKLVQFWRQDLNTPEAGDGKFYSILATEDRRQRKDAECQKLYAFLKAHASGHMGWRGDGDDGADRTQSHVVHEIYQV